MKKYSIYCAAAAEALLFFPILAAMVLLAAIVRIVAFVAIVPFVSLLKFLPTEDAWEND